MSDLQDAINITERSMFEHIELVEFTEALRTVNEAARRVANPDYEAAAGYLYGSHDHKATKKARQVVSLALDVTEDE